jgi:hypothetical protein
MVLGRPKARLIVSPSERQALQRLTRRRKTAQALALRARIVLACAAGRDNRDVAEEPIGRRRSPRRLRRTGPRAGSEIAPAAYPLLTRPSSSNGGRRVAEI